MNLEVIYGDTDSIMINTNSVDFAEGELLFKRKKKQEKFARLHIGGLKKNCQILLSF